MDAHGHSFENTPLTEEQEEAFQYYQRDGYLKMYYLLDKGIALGKRSYIEEQIRQMDSAFKPTEEDLLVYRTEREHDTPSKSYVSTTAWVEQAAVYTYKKDSKVHAYLIPKGTPVIKRFAEQEVILPRNTDMKKYRIR